MRYGKADMRHKQFIKIIPQYLTQLKQPWKFEMIIKYRVGWPKEKINFLKKYTVKSKEENNFFLIEFDDKTEGYGDILSYAEKDGFCITQDAEFSQQEMENSQWYAVDTVWTNLYPYPVEKFRYLHQTYDLTDYCRGNEPKYFCRIGKVQNSHFCIAKEPRWASRNFMRLNLVTEELFVSMYCKEKLQKANLKGFDFEYVFRKDKISEDIFQLKINNTLPKCLKRNNFEQTYTCPICGRSKYWLKSGFIMAEKYPFENAGFDIVKTAEKFGQVDADSLIIISKRMYDFLIAEKLSKGMKFIPLILE